LVKSRERRGARDLHPLFLHSYIKFPIANHQPDFVVTMEYLNCMFVCFVLLVFMSKLYLCLLGWLFCCHELFVLLFLLSRFFSLCEIVLVLQFCYEILYQILSSKGQHEGEWLVFMNAKLL
jgi:hypothetical protein